MAVLFLALEAALRAFWPEDVPFAGLFMEDATVGVRHIPHAETVMSGEGRRIAVRMNSRGFRGREYDWSAPHGFRILGIGDSFTFGYGVSDDETFLSRLEAGLHGRVDVINAGVSGMGPENEARLLAADGPGLRPDLVLVGFFVGNDFTDVLTGARRFHLVDGFPMLPDGFVERWYRPLRPGRLLERPLARSSQGLDLPIPFKRVLRRHSMAYRFLARRVGMLRRAWQGRHGTTAPAAEATPFDQEAFCIRSYPPEFEEAWATTKRLLGEMKSWCDQHDARLVIVAIPAESQVYPDRWEQARRSWPLREADFDLEKPQRLLTEFASGAGIPLIDLLPTLRTARETGARLYSRRDIHWSPRGHAVAAEEILRQLRTMSLVPES